MKLLREIIPNRLADIDPKQTRSERKRAFCDLVVKWIATHDPQHEKNPKWLCREFCLYWTDSPDGSEKMNFELLPKKDRERWSTGGRLATCRNLYQYDKRWKNSPTAWRKYYDLKYAASLTPQQHVEYKAYLSTLGWTFGGADGVGYWYKGPNQPRKFIV